MSGVGKENGTTSGGRAFTTVPAYSAKLSNSPAWRERLSALGALDASFAHQINNPIGAIMLIAQNALEQKGDPNPRKLLERTCNKVISHAERCVGIIKGMLQFSHLRKSEKKMEDLNAIVKYAFDLTCELRGKGRSRPYLKLANDLPSILVNSVEIEQVIVNLIKNAYEAGSREVTVSTNLKNSNVKNSAVELCVEDQGHGISPEALKYIFDPFYTTRLEEGGIGLGLTIIDGIIRDHTGEITITSKLGKGTKVIITFLAVEDHALVDAVAKTEELAYG